MTIETNRNPNQMINGRRITSRFSKWTPINSSKIKLILGLLIWMVLIPMPSLKNYWSIKTRYKNHMTSKIMFRNRFELLLRCWHFSNNEEAPENDRIFKVQNLVIKIVNNFQKTLEPDSMLVVDETMVPFRGRLKCR